MSSQNKMDVLELEHRIFGAAGRGKYLTFGDFIVNGKPVFDTRADQITLISEQWGEHVSETQIERLLGNREPDLPGGRTTLYVCPVCGDISDGVLSANIVFEPERVVWKDFGWQNDVDEGFELLDTPIGVYEFDRKQYELAITTALAEMLKKPATQQHGGRIPCACCEFLTFYKEDEGHYFICPVCFWEDDRLDTNYEIETSAVNHDMTLKEGKQNYKKLGAVQERLVKYIRPPLDEEIAPGMEKVAAKLSIGFQQRFEKQANELNHILNKRDLMRLKRAKITPHDEYDCLVWPLIYRLQEHALEKEIKEYLQVRMATHFRTSPSRFNLWRT
jgi:hypothetical protein